MKGQPNEKTTRIAEEALARLSAELEAGRSDSLTNYLEAMGRFHRYSWGNVLLIHSQRPTATQVAGIHTWNDFGRTVKKGEKGIMILAPIVVKRPDAEPERDAIKPDQPYRVSGFRTAYVFDVAQTEGKALPEFAKTTGEPKDYTEKLKTFVANQGITVEYDSSIGPAQGLSSGGRIRLKPDLSHAEEFSVLVHELAHEMLHHVKDGPRPPKVVCETQAEAVAFVVCRGIGLETNNAAADYIALYNGDKNTLAESLSAIQATSTKILDQILPERSLPAPRMEAAAQRESSANQDRPSSQTLELAANAQTETRTPDIGGPDR